jgi:glycosyltransferase involved in cell wall biosynthesis
MTSLRVMVDQLVAPVPGGIGRYTAELTRQLIRTAPQGCEVVGVVSATSPDQQADVRQKLPGLARLDALRFGRRELSLGWQHGLPISRPRGMLHAPSLFAPLTQHRRDEGDQIVVTIHDAVPWTHPETLTPHGVTWHKAMAKRAHRFADAVVVDTHAVAQQLGDFIDFGDRLRVIGAAASPEFMVPPNSAERAATLGLPERYVLSVGTLEPRKGLGFLVQAMAEVDADIPLLIAGPEGWGDVRVADLAAEAGLPRERVRTLGYLNDTDLALTMQRATVFAFPSLAEGFGLPIVEAFQMGTPVVHSDDAALMEVAADAGVSVKRGDLSAYPMRLAEAINDVLHNTAHANDLAVRGRDRSRAFSWRGAAEQVWQLHADL